MGRRPYATNEARCAPQQNSMSIGSFGSKAPAIQPTQERANEVEKWDKVVEFSGVKIKVE